MEHKEGGTSNMHASADFVLHGGDAAFANRQKQLFDQLLIAESKYNKDDKSTTDDTVMHVEVDKCQNKTRVATRDALKLRRVTKRYRGKQSIFKHPEGPAPRTNIRSIPDYHKNPHKWTKYSLHDVSNEDMTERSNTWAATSFLRELRARRKKEKANEDEKKRDVEPCELDMPETMFKSRKHTPASQIVFKKPETKEAENLTEPVVIESDEKPIFQSSKIILPEYVVGQKPKKICKQKRPVVKVDRIKELQLDHLQEPDEEEDN